MPTAPSPTPAPCGPADVARRSRQSADKRIREKRRQERQAAKRDRRQARGDDTDAVEIDEAALMEQYRLLCERHAAGAVDDDDFEAERHELFVALGLEDP